MHLDTNSPYGLAMSQYLPTGDFKWLNEKEIKNINLAKYTPESDKGLTLEVENCMTATMVTHLQHIKCFSRNVVQLFRKNKTKHNISVGQVKKLIPTFSTKTNYVLHYTNLKQYKKLRLTVIKVHRVLQFKQSTWLKQCIDFNIQKRTQAADSFEKISLNS